MPSVLLLLAACSWWSTPEEPPICPDGQQATGGRCCWPGQAATAEGCTGAPTACPDPWTRTDADCVPPDLPEIATAQVAPGTFTFGCAPEMTRFCLPSGENRSVPVTLTVPLIAMRHEVTQALYTALMGTNPSRVGDCPNCPVDQVTWYDAVRFANRLSLRDGLPPAYTVVPGEGDAPPTVDWDPASPGWRLPTEAEWEYLAQGGELHTYAGSDDPDEVAVWEGNSFGAPAEVGSKAPNGYGLYDMSGNAWEWVYDHPAPNPDPPPVEPLVDPRGPDAPITPHGVEETQAGDERVVKGGGWSDWHMELHPGYRAYISGQHTVMWLGFRLVRNAEPPAPTEG